MNERVLDKIKKLLALSNSDNEHEARLAAEKACEILIRHNLTMQDAQRDIFYAVHNVEGRLKNPPEDKFIRVIIDNHFFVQTINQIKRTMYSKNKTNTLKFIGKKENVEIAVYVYQFLTHEYKRLWSLYKFNNKLRERDRASYYIGLNHGLDEQLSLKRKSVETETGLVVIKDTDLAKYIREELGRVTTRTSKINGVNASVSKAGYSDGLAMKIRKGITHSNVGHVTLLT